MKYRILLQSILSTAFILLVSICQAQNDIGITLNIVPPYSPRFTDYVETPGKILLIIRNNTNQPKSIYLRGSVTGDNGVSLFADPNTKSSQPLVLQPYQVYNATNSTLQELFAIEKYKMTGITLSEMVTKNGLPEGNYDVCVRAFDYNTNAPLSADAPQGCKLLPIASLEPPYPIKPMADEAVKALEPQNVVFSWTIPAGAEPGTQYKLRIIEMLNPNKNINDAFNSGTTPPFFEAIVSANVFVYGPGQPKLVAGRKYAWAVTAIPGSKKVAYKNNGRSEVRSFIFTKPEPPKPIITLLYPADKANMPPIAGISQNAFTFKWEFTYPGAKSAIYENIEMYEVKQGQTPEQAITKNDNVIYTKEPTGSQYFNYNDKGSPDGKTFAWFVTLNYNGKIFKSEMRTFTVGANENTNQQIPEFDLCGFPVKVTSLKDEGGYTYSGTGTTSLYKGGKEFPIKFWSITIQPFAVESDSKTKKPVFKNWRAVKYNYKAPVEYDFFYLTNIDYKLPADVGGTLWYNAKKISFNPNITTEFDNNKKIFAVKETGSSHGVLLHGTFTWETGMVCHKQNDDTEPVVFKSSGEGKPYDYATGFKPENVNYMSRFNEKNMPDNKNIWLYEKKKIILDLTPKLSIVNKGKDAKFEFYGSYTIKSPKNNKPDITVPINGNSLIINQKLPSPYKATLNDDNSASCSFDTVKLDLVHYACSLKIPNLKLAINYNGTVFSFAYKKAFFSPFDGVYCKESSIGNNDLTISGFPVKIDTSKLTLVKTGLAQLFFAGTISIPFINQKAGVSFNVIKEGVEEASVSCDYDKEMVLFQNIDGDKCTLKAGTGMLKSDRIEIGGGLTITNINSPDKNIHVKDISMPIFYIKSNGDVGMKGSTSVPYHVAGSYKGFKFVPYAVDIKKIVDKKYKIMLNGMVVLADNLASDTKLPNFSTSAEFDVSKNTGGGPPPNQEVKFDSGEVYGGRKDAAVDFGVQFKYFNGDATYGKGFMSEGYFGVQQPDPMQVHAKMLVAKAPEGFNYWFFEAGQENVIQIPTGVLDLGIYGFTGRAYYKMKHSGTNIYKDDYVPNNDMFIGIYGLTQLKTLTDNGVKFWGKVGFEVATNKWGLESIKFRGDGEFVTQGVGTNGTVRAHDCQLDFYWEPKEVFGIFNTSADFYGAVTIDANAGFDVTADAFHLWGKGKANLFGSADFSSSDCGFDCTQDNINIYGNFNMVDFNKCLDLGICEPCVKLQSKFGMDAYVNYNPFQFKGQGVMSGALTVSGCKLSKTFNVNLFSQVMFPSPTCVSAGIKVRTPLKNFSLSAGVKSGTGIFWGSCF